MATTATPTAMTAIHKPAAPTPATSMAAATSRRAAVIHIKSDMVTISLSHVFTLSLTMLTLSSVVTEKTSLKTRATQRLNA